MSICPASGFFIESTPGGDLDHGNFEVVVNARDTGGGLLHYWRDNSTDGYPWIGPNRFGSRQYNAVSLCESDFKTFSSNDEYNLEVLAQYGKPIAATFSTAHGVDHAWRENGGDWLWTGPNATSIAGGVANPSLIAERYRPSNTTNWSTIGVLMAIVPNLLGGFSYYLRDQNFPFSWNHFSNVPGPRLQGTAFLSSFVHSGSVKGNGYGVAVGDLVVAAVVDDGTLVLFCRRAEGTGTWDGPIAFGRDILEGSVGKIFAGRPSIIMSDFNYNDPGDLNFSVAHYGNYELIVPLKDGGIAYFWKDNGDVTGGLRGDLDNNDIRQGWTGYSVFGEGVYSEVSMIQSNLGSGDHGHIEVVARRHDQIGFDFYWRDDDLTTWHGPSEVT